MMNDSDAALPPLRVSTVYGADSDNSAKRLATPINFWILVESHLHSDFPVLSRQNKLKHQDRMGILAQAPLLTPHVRDDLGLCHSRFLPAPDVFWRWRQYG